MNKIQNGRFFILLVLLACSMMSTAQNEKNFDEFKKAQVKEFATFAEQTQKGFDQYSDSINKEFSDYLRKNWAEFKVFSGVKHDTTPKPNSLPEFNPSVDKIKPRGVPTEIKVQMPEPGEALNILQIPITPFIQKQEPAESPWNIRHYNFTGPILNFSLILK